MAKVVDMVEMEAWAGRLSAVNTRFFAKPLVEIAEDFKYRQDALFSNEYAESETCYCK